MKPFQINQHMFTMNYMDVHNEEVCAWVGACKGNSCSTSLDCLRLDWEWMDKGIAREVVLHKEWLGELCCLHATASG